MTEYVVIKKSALQAIQERIDECKANINNPAFTYKQEYIRSELNALERFLPQSTPLIPIVEAAFDAGGDWQEGGTILYPDRHGYISNLKLDI